MPYDTSFNDPHEIPIFEALGDYEAWVRQNWLYEAGSDSAQVHISNKLREEIAEFSEALRSEAPQDILSEAGDVLWTASAVACNEGYSLERAFRVSSIGSRIASTSVDVEVVDELASTMEPIVWDVPGLRSYLDKTDLSLHEEIMQGDSEITEAVLYGLAQRLAKSTRITHALDKIGEPDGWTRLHEGRTVETLSQLVLLTTFAVRRKTGYGLRTIMDENFKKIEGRIARGEQVSKHSTII